MGKNIRISRVARVSSTEREGSMFLISQGSFPYKYDSSLNKRMIVCQEKIRSGHMEACFLKHSGKDCKYNLEKWIQRANDGDVLSFLIDVMKADKSVQWTGFRVTGYLYGGTTSQAILTFDLFAKHTESDTKVYTGPSAPNVYNQSVLLKPKELIFSPEAYNDG